MTRTAMDLLSRSRPAEVKIKEGGSASAASRERGASAASREGEASAAAQRRAKLELTLVTVKEAERDIGQWLRTVFHQRKTIAQKVVLLFNDAAANLETSGFTRGCPPAVVMSQVGASEELRVVCRAVFAVWQDIIAAGLDEVRPAARRETAELILGALEGALILSRAAATKEPLLRSGRSLAGLLARKFQAAPSGRKAKRSRRKR